MTTRSWRDRLLWTGSPEALGIVLSPVALLTMIASLIWTMSRSGMGGCAVVISILLIASASRAGSGARRWIIAGYVAAIAVGVIAWKGLDNIVSWYGNTTTFEWRVELWRDTLPVLRDFWTTGSGLNTYGTLMLVYPRTDLSVQPQQAHSDYLQLAVEGGLLVGIPALILAAAIARAIVRRLRQPQDEMTWWIRLGAVAAICGMAVQELTEFSLQLPGVALLFATCVGIALHEPASVDVRSKRVRRHHEPELVTQL